MSAILVYVTCTDQQEASTIAESLVGKQLAACVNIFPAVESIFRFEGEIHVGHEIVVIIKTNEAAYPELQNEVKKLHSYQVPCIVKVPLSGGDSEFYSLGR